MKSSINPGAALKPRHKRALLRAYHERMQMVYPSDAKQLEHLLQALDILGVPVPEEDRRNWREYQ